MFTLFRHETFFLMVQDGSLLEAFIATLMSYFILKGYLKVTSINESIFLFCEPYSPFPYWRDSAGFYRITRKKKLDALVTNEFN